MVLEPTALLNGQNNEGRAYIYYGSPSGLESTAAWVTESDQTGALYGRIVGSAGDVDGDGYSDVIVGSYLYDNGQTDEGKAFLYHGSASGVSATAAWTVESDQVGARLSLGGCRTAGDVDGDGYGDVIVSAYFADNGQDNEGIAFVFLGSAEGLGDSVCFADNDGDGFACDDSDPHVYPGAPERCNGKDDNCDTFIFAYADDGAVAACLTDSDRDGRRAPPQIPAGPATQESSVQGLSRPVSRGSSSRQKQRSRTSTTSRRCSFRHRPESASIHRVIHRPGLRVQPPRGSRLGGHAGDRNAAQAFPQHGLVVASDGELTPRAGGPRTQDFVL